MIGLVALAWAAGAPRAAGEAAEEARAFPTAVEAYRECVAEGPDLDRRFCEARLAVLEPQAGDGFAGWRLLEDVRRDYKALGAEEALTRVEAGLRAMPESPAAPSMKLWIANEKAKRGDTRAARSLAADTTVPPATRAWLGATDDAAVANARRLRLGVAGAALGLVYAVVGWRREGPLAGRSALAAAGLLGVVPAALAGAYGSGQAPGFLRAGAVATLCVLAAPRVPLWVSVPGTVGALVAVAGWNGWLPSLGL